MHIFTSFKRIIKTGTLNFFRNGWLSTATISVLTITLFITFSLIMSSVLTETLVSDLKNRVDISVYFKKDVKEDSVLGVRNDVLALPEVKSAVYVSEDDALIAFREKHSDNEVIIQSLDALEENPLEASLNIKAKDTVEFEKIAQFLEQEKYGELISKINYYENKDLIDKLNSLISSIRKVGFTAGAILIIVAFLVAFNTIRMTIFTMKGEIGVMKLVGAGNWFVRGPFMVEGFLYGLASSLITMFLVFPMLFFSYQSIEGFFPGVNLYEYLKVNFFQIWIILLVVGSGIGVLGSAVAMQRYLKV